MTTNKPTDAFLNLLQEDRRYRLEAYAFVREALAYAQSLHASSGKKTKSRTSKTPSAELTINERHMTGRQLCEAIRQLAAEQFGMMAPVVFRSWGIRSTSDFGEIVYNLIRIGHMKQSKSDRREDFDDVYDFDDVFLRDFRISTVDQD